MRGVEDELLRWRAGATDPSALPARAADLVDAARDVPAPPPLVLARIYAHIADRDGRRPARLRGAPMGLRLATLMVLLLMSAATAKGAMVLWQRYVGPVIVPIVRPMFERGEPRRAPRARPKVAVAESSRPRAEATPVLEPIAHDPPSVVPPPATLAPKAVEAPAAPPRARRAVSSERRMVAAPPTAPVEAADPTNEAQLLADAIARLRQQHDPRGALALLDRYSETYPRGVLASEARSARIEAMLKVGDRAGALGLLDERATFAGRLGAEQLLTRAELRASVGRYADALGDFDRLLAASSPLAASVPGSEVERALYGRAVTLGHLGHDRRARADLEAYQRRFPNGRNAAEVTRLLQGGPR